MDPWGVFLLAFMILLVIVIIFMLQSYAKGHDEQAHERYRQELKRLNKQLEEKQISEDSYKELKRELDEKYKEVI
jgi:uncharacterized membrane protein